MVTTERSGEELTDTGVDFSDSLEITATLTLAKKKHVVKAGNIKEFSLNLDYTGFSGTLDWWEVNLHSESEDKAFAGFIKDDLIEVDLKIERGSHPVGTSSEPLTLTGYVTEKSMVERSFGETKKKLVLQRQYSIAFADIAQVMWRQHFPFEILVGSSIKALIEGHRPKKLKLTYDWPASQDTHTILALPLGNGQGVSAGQEMSAAHEDVSFYDFLMWLLNRENACFFYDANKDAYTIAAKKPKAAAKPSKISKLDVGHIRTVFPPTRRHKVRVLNSYADPENPKANPKKWTKDIPNSQAMASIELHHLMRAPTPGSLQKRETLEKARNKSRQHRAQVNFIRFPTFTIRPGTQHDFSHVSPSLHSGTKKYRCLSYRIDATAANQDPMDRMGKPQNIYRMNVSALLELETETLFRYPEFKRPHYPFYVEGKVLSEIGEDAEKKKELTFQAYKEKGTDIEHYQVKVPLWNDLKVMTKYEPNRQKGHFYFPLYKDERVLLEVYFQHIKIDEHLDWRPGAKLPHEDQGNHLLMGKNDESQTSMRHIYAENKPLLDITRRNKLDRTVIVAEEGEFSILVSDKKEEKKKKK